MLSNCESTTSQYYFMYGAGAVFFFRLRQKSAKEPAPAPQRCVPAQLCATVCASAAFGCKLVTIWTGCRVFSLHFLFIAGALWLKIPAAMHSDALTWTSTLKTTTRSEELHVIV